MTGLTDSLFTFDFLQKDVLFTGNFFSSPFSSEISTLAYPIFSDIDDVLIPTQFDVSNLSSYIVFFDTPQITALEYCDVLGAWLYEYEVGEELTGDTVRFDSSIDKWLDTTWWTNFQSITCDSSQLSDSDYIAFQAQQLYEIKQFVFFWFIFLVLWFFMYWGSSFIFNKKND